MVNEIEMQDRGIPTSAAFKMLQNEPENFLKQYPVRIRGSLESGVTDFVFSKFLTNEGRPYFKIQPDDGIASHGISFKAHNLAVQKLRNAQLENIHNPADTLEIEGYNLNSSPDVSLMMTTQLSGCAFCFKDFGENGFFVAHIQPSEEPINNTSIQSPQENINTSAVQDILIKHARFNGFPDEQLNVFGGSLNYNNTEDYAYVIGSKNTTGEWTPHIQITNRDLSSPVIRNSRTNDTPSASATATPSTGSISTGIITASGIIGAIGAGIVPLITREDDKESEDESDDEIQDSAEEESEDESDDEIQDSAEEESEDESDDEIQDSAEEESEDESDDEIQDSAEEESEDESDDEIQDSAEEESEDESDDEIQDSAEEESEDESDDEIQDSAEEESEDESDDEIQDSAEEESEDESDDEIQDSAEEESEDESDDEIQDSAEEESEDESDDEIQDSADDQPSEPQPQPQPQPAPPVEPVETPEDEGEWIPQRPTGGKINWI